jgi:hypothetical protein
MGIGKAMVRSVNNQHMMVPRRQLSVRFPNDPIPNPKKKSQYPVLGIWYTIQTTTVRTKRLLQTRAVPSAKIDAISRTAIGTTTFWSAKKKQEFIEKTSKHIASSPVHESSIHLFSSDLLSRKFFRFPLFLHSLTQRKPICLKEA